MGFTVRQIAELAYEKFDIHSSYDACIKKIRKIISEKNIQSIGYGKSTITSRNKAALYSEEVKDNMIYDWLFDYLKNLSNSEAVEKMKSVKHHYQSEADKINEAYAKDMNYFLENGIAPSNDDPYGNLTKYSQRVRERKLEIMIEALFSQHFSMDIVNLVNDMNKGDFIIDQHQSDFTSVDILFFERLNNWKTYVKENHGA